MFYTIAVVCASLTAPAALEVAELPYAIIHGAPLSNHEVLCVLLDPDQGRQILAVLDLSRNTVTPWEPDWKPEDHHWLPSRYFGAGVSPDGNHVYVLQEVGVPGDFVHGYSNTALMLLITAAPDGSGAAPAAMGRSPVGGDRILIYCSPDSKYLLGNNIHSDYIPAPEYARYLEETRGSFPYQAVNAYCLESERTLLLSREEDDCDECQGSVALPSPSRNLLAVMDVFEGEVSSISFCGWNPETEGGRWTAPDEGCFPRGWFGELGVIVNSRCSPVLVTPDGTAREIPGGERLNAAAHLADGSWLLSWRSPGVLEHGFLDGESLGLISADTLGRDGEFAAGTILPLPGSGALILSPTRPYRSWHLRPVNMVLEPGS